MLANMDVWGEVYKHSARLKSIKDIEVYIFLHKLLILYIYTQAYIHESARQMHTPKTASDF